MTFSRLSAFKTHGERNTNPITLESLDITNNVYQMLTRLSVGLFARKVIVSRFPSREEYAASFEG